MLRIILLITALTSILFVYAEDIMDVNLKGLEPFAGKTYKGEFSTSTADKPMFDIQQWEVILGGKAVRIMHSVNDGDYGGETVIFWDAAKESVVYYYFTNAGFHTTGTMEFAAGKVISYEEIHNNQNGITAAKSIGEVLPDGRIKNSSEYLKNGEWIPGHEVIYTEDAAAEVIFK